MRQAKVSPRLASAALFFVVMVTTEILFSTKVGDLGKMANESRKQAPGGAVSAHTP